MNKFKLLSLAVLLSLSVNAATIEENFSSAMNAYNSGDFNKAGDLFLEVGNELSKKDKAKAVPIWNNAATSKLQAEKFSEAESIYQLILKSKKNLTPDEAVLYYTNLSICLKNLKEKSKLIETEEKLIKQGAKKLSASEKTNAYAAIGDAYKDLELYVEAVNAYGNALKAMPKEFDQENRANIYTALGLCQGQLGQYMAAESNLDKAAKIAQTLNIPLTLAESYSNLGLLAHEKGDYQKAQKLISDALDIETKEKFNKKIAVDKNNLGAVKRITGDTNSAMKLYQESADIAESEKDIRSEGIAVFNIGNTFRSIGQFSEASDYYEKALKLYKECGYKEGIAIAHLGIGTMYKVRDRDYQNSLQEYEEALKIFDELSLVRHQAETYNLLGELYKAIAFPGKSSTRDLVFDDDDDSPKVPQISSKDSLLKSKEYFSKALKIAEPLSNKEIVWNSEQGLGFYFYKNNELEESLNHYKKAIDIVSNLYISAESVQMMGEYMAGKQDLYQEAMSVCSALYDKTKDKKYLELMLNYQNTLNNDVQKANAAVANIHFEDPAKQKLYEKLNLLGKQQEKVRKAIPIVPAVTDKSSEEERIHAKQAQNAEKSVKADIKRVEGEYQKALAEWKQKYPNDSGMFDSASRVDFKMIQDNLEPDQVALQYVTLQDLIVINAISKDKVVTTTVSVSRKDLERIIKNDFMVGYIEKGYGRAHYATNKPYKKDPAKYTGIDYAQEEFEKVNKILSQLYGYLIKPIEDFIKEKNRIYVINDGYLASVPYACLVSKIDSNGSPTYLVEDHDIAYLRPSFVNALAKKNVQGKIKKILAVGNAENKNFQMGLLEGSISEISKADANLNVGGDKKDIALEVKYDGMSQEQAETQFKSDFKSMTNLPPRPTELWLRDQLSKSNYEILYFATHGMPYSNVVSTVKGAMNKVKKGDNSFLPYVKIAESNLKSKSPLNGFLYLSSEEGDDILKSQIPEEQDGLLTLKDIMQLKDKDFINTKFVVLSACNTAVTFVPAYIAENGDDDITLFNEKDTEKELKDQGWIPGVDQVSFVETFMKKGVNDVYGNLWFADDEASSVLMSKFVEYLVAQKDKPDAVAALNDAQRFYIKGAKNKEIKFNNYPLHPYYWALAAMFGK